MLLARKKKSSICNSFISITFNFRNIGPTTARCRWLCWEAFYGAGLEAWWVVEKMVWQFWFALVSKPRKSIGLERRFDCQWPRDLLPCVADPLRADCWVGDTVGDGTEDVEVEKPPWPGGEDQEGVEPKSCRAFNHKGKLAPPLAAKMTTTPVK